MKFPLPSQIFALTLTLTSFASSTTDPIAEHHRNNLNTLIVLVLENRISEMADRVEYPLRRPSPIPWIKNRDEFILYYPVLVDEWLESKITNTAFTTQNTIDRAFQFGILQGSIWMNAEGRIIAINHHSQAELRLLRKLEEEQKRKMHHSVAEWQGNELTVTSEKHLIRIDMMDNGRLRYASWNKPKGISDKPDLIIQNGQQEFDGSIGNISYVFKNGDWVYRMDLKVLAESEDEVGWSLRVFEGEKEVVVYKLTEVGGQ